MTSYRILITENQGLWYLWYEMFVSGNHWYDYNFSLWLLNWKGKVFQGHDDFELKFDTMYLFQLH